MLLSRNELTAEERLSKAVVTILGDARYTALAGVLMIGNKTIKDDLPTACTNGRDEMYGRAFVDGLNDAEFRGLILHENYHKLYRHLSTWRHLWKEDAQVANMAMDYVINLKIMDDNKDGFATLPEGALIDSKYTGMDTAKVYKLLRQAQESSGGEGSSGSQGNESGDGGTGIGSDGSGRADPTAGLDEHDWRAAESLTEEEGKQLERDIDEAVRQGALTAGKSGGNVPRDFEELMKAKVDWREVLREFISNTCKGNDYSTWARPNRRLLGQGVYLPSGISESMDELVIAVDTSGSMGQRELTIMLSEVKAVCDTVKPNKIRLLYWGHTVVGDEVYGVDELDSLVKSTKPKGGGGTDVTCVTDYMTEHNISPQAALVLTDGYLYGGWGNWTCPVLWAIIDNEHANPTVGKRVHIKSGDM